jgi:hypothetical protein
MLSHRKGDKKCRNKVNDDDPILEQTVSRPDDGRGILDKRSIATSTKNERDS